MKHLVGLDSGNKPALTRYRGLRYKKPIPKPMSQARTSMKQGAAIGGWICFGLGILLMFKSVWLFFLYGPLFFVAFILSIVAIAQKRLVLGLALLLADLVIPAVLWLVLSATRAEKYMKSHPGPLGRNSSEHISPSASITEKPAKDTIALKSNQANMLTAVREAYSQDISKVDAHSMQIAYQTTIDQLASVRFRPVFSGDSKLLMYPHEEPSGVNIIFKRLDTLETIRTIRTQRDPVNVALSPDGQRLLYLTHDSHIIISRLADRGEVELPIIAAGNAFFDTIRWVSEKKVMFGGSKLLDLDDLKYTGTANTAGRPRSDSKYKLTYEMIGPSNWGFHAINRDGSYGRLLLACNVHDNGWSISDDQRHIAFVSRAGDKNELILCYLGVREAPRKRMTVNASEIQGRPDSRANLFRLQPGQSTNIWPVYGAKINPLNQKIIGHEDNDYCGTARLQRSSGDDWPVTVTYEKRPFKDGDVLQLESTWWIWAPIHVADFSQEQNVNQVSSPSTSWAGQSPESNADGDSEAADIPPSSSSRLAGALPKRDLPRETQLAGEKFVETRSRMLAAAELRSWPDVKLQYAINEMFARHGADFDNQVVKNWFSQFPWYNPKIGSTSDEIEMSLTTVEWQNLQLLAREREARSRGVRNHGTTDGNRGNSLAKRLLESVLKGVQQGLEKRH